MKNLAFVILSLGLVAAPSMAFAGKYKIKWYVHAVRDLPDAPITERCDLYFAEIENKLSEIEHFLGSNTAATDSSAEPQAQLANHKSSSKADSAPGFVTLETDVEERTNKRSGRVEQHYCDVKLKSNDSRVKLKWTRTGRISTPWFFAEMDARNYSACDSLLAEIQADPQNLGAYIEKRSPGAAFWSYNTCRVKYARVKVSL